MTRKDYIIIAAAFAAARGAHGEAPALLDAETLMATALRHDNPRFDRERFFAACERTS